MQSTFLTNPFDLWSCKIIGFEGESGEVEGGKPAEDAPGENGKPEANKSGDAADDKSKEPEDVTGLKTALETERKNNKEMAKQLKKLTDAQEAAANKDKTDGEKATIEANKAKTQTAALATKLKDGAVNLVILKHAGVLKFADVDDALRLIDRDAVTVTQEEDDPSDVEVDEASVKKALEKLAKSKPHLIKVEGSGGPSGGKFGGGGKGDKGKLSDEELKKKYPALR